MFGGHGFSLCCGVDHGSPSWRNGANLIAFMLFAGDACFEFVPAVSSLRITAVRTALTIAFGVLQKKQASRIQDVMVHTPLFSICVHPPGLSHDPGGISYGHVCSAFGLTLVDMLSS